MHVLITEEMLVPQTSQILLLGGERHVGGITSSPAVGLFGLDLLLLFTLIILGFNSGDFPKMET